jgi:hypothetical protein
LRHRGKRSSQYGIVIEMPFDFVADVTCCGRRRELERELQDAIDAFARTPIPGRRFPGPCPRTIGRRPTNTALGIFADDDEVDVTGFAVRERVAMPGMSRHGRRFTYWSKRRRN